MIRIIKITKSGEFGEYFEDIIESKEIKASMLDDEDVEDDGYYEQGDSYDIRHYYIDGVNVERDTIKKIKKQWDTYYEHNRQFHSFFKKRDISDEDLSLLRRSGYRGHRCNTYYSDHPDLVCVYRDGKKGVFFDKNKKDKPFVRAIKTNRRGDEYIDYSFYSQGCIFRS